MFSAHVAGPGAVNGTAWEQRAGAVLRRLEGVEAPVMAELGAGVCRMARVLLAERSDLTLHLVDNFLAREQQPQGYLATRDNFAARDAATAERHRAEAREFIRRRRPRVALHEADTATAASFFSGGSLDLVFVDADHSYEGVKRDIAHWLRKVKPGGWLGGHDYDNADPRFDFSGVKRAVDEFGRNFGKRIEGDANFTWWVRL